jgi:hypothetical protein
MILRFDAVVVTIFGARSKALYVGNHRYYPREKPRLPVRRSCSHRSATAELRACGLSRSSRGAGGRQAWVPADLFPANNLVQVSCLWSAGLATGGTLLSSGMMIHDTR